MISFFQLFGGYCKVEITGTGKERFLNLCRNKKILIWNLLRKDESYVFCVSYKTHGFLKEIGEKTNTKVRIEGKYGLPFFLYRHKKRKMFFSGLLLSAMLIYILSLFVWEIQVEGTVRYTPDEVKTYLKEFGITTGILKKRINCSALEEKIREDFEDTAWVSCDLTGTLLTVHVKESIDTSDMVREDSVPNDIIASRDGIIESIVTRNGTPLVKKGAEVKKGDTIISGVIYIYNEYDELLETSTVSADGDVKALTGYEYEETFSLQYYEKVYTGKSTKEYSLCLGNYKLPSVSGKVTYENYDAIGANHFLKIGSSFYLPVSLYVTEYAEYSSKMVNLTEAQAKEKAREKINYYLSQLEKEGKEIREKTFDISVEEGECRIAGNVTVVESIGKIRNIP